jgi:hypothetical protein
VIKSIDELVAEHKADQAQDLKDRDECVSTRHKHDEEIAELKWKVEVNDRNIGIKEQEIQTAEDKIAENQAGKKETIKNKTEAKALRKIEFINAEEQG